VSSVAAELNGDIELIDQVEALQIANRDRIQTWSGAILINRRDRNEVGSYEMIDLLWYAIDRGQQSHSVRWQTIGSRFHRFGNRDPEIDTYTMCRGGRLILGGQVYAFDQRSPGEWSQEANVTVGHGFSLSSSPYSSSAKIDPLDYFKLGPEHTPEEYFSGMRQLKLQEWSESSVSRQGQTIQLVVRVKDKPGQIEHFFDLNTSGMLRKYHNTNMVAGAYKLLNYELIGGVHVPRHVFVTGSPPGGFPNSEKTVYWLEQQVNEPLDERMFTLEFIGVPAGSRVNDRLGGKQYEFTPDPAVLEYVNTLIAKHLPQQDAAPVGVDQPERADRKASSAAVEASSEEVQTPVGQKSLSWLLLPPVLLLGVGLGFWMGNRKG
jgi:hypothetical protein